MKPQLILTNLIILGIICGGLYLANENFKKNEKIRLDTINKEYKYSKGIITEIKYSRRSLSVKYKIDGQVFNSDGSWDNNPNELDEGDSISFRYSSENPEYIITELEKEYFINSPLR